MRRVPEPPIRAARATVVRRLVRVWFRWGRRPVTGSGWRPGPLRPTAWRPAEARTWLQPQWVDVPGRHIPDVGKYVRSAVEPDRILTGEPLQLRVTKARAIVVEIGPVVLAARKLPRIRTARSSHTRFAERLKRVVRLQRPGRVGEFERAPGRIDERISARSSTSRRSTLTPSPTRQGAVAPWCCAAAPQFRNVRKFRSGTPPFWVARFSIRAEASPEHPYMRDAATLARP